LPGPQMIRITTRTMMISGRCPVIPLNMSASSLAPYFYSP
jgi:hypothetical protein